MEKNQFFSLLILYSAPTLTGIKSASLFGCRMDTRQALERHVRDASRRLKGCGIRVLLLSYQNGRGLIYVFRPAMLARDLTSPLAQSILQQNGYSCRCWYENLLRLKHRLAGCDDFPHEIGLFLGYPAADVDGFIRLGPSACLCSGVWKVYKNPDQAKAVFAQCQKCTQQCMQLWTAGTPVEQLAVTA